MHLGVALDLDSGRAEHSAYLWVDDADAFADEWLAVGAEVHFPEETEWGHSEGAFWTPTARSFVGRRSPDECLSSPCW